MTNLDSIFKSRDITLPTKFRLVKAMVFPVVMYGCESWTVKKAEHWRIDAFELWCWRRLLRVPWTAGDPTSPFWRSALDFFGRNDAKAETPVLWPPQEKSWLIGKDWCWEGLGAGGEGDEMAGWDEMRRRGWDGWMASLTRWTWVWVNSGSWWWPGGLACCDSWGCEELDTTERLNWTELNCQLELGYFISSSPNTGLRFTSGFPLVFKSSDSDWITPQTFQNL